MPRADGPFEIVEKIGSNAYKVDLPSDYEVHDTFNMGDLSPYYDSDDEEATVKEMLKDGFHDNKWTMSTKGYSIKEGHAWLAPDQPTLNWTNIMWNNWNIPKHSLTTWLRMNEGMNVKSKLFRFGCCTDDWCILCQRQPETVEHLFTSCVYSVRVQRCLLHWFGGTFTTVDRLSAENRNTLQWKFKVAMFNAYHYFIWFQRNNARINDWLSRPEVVAVRIEDDIKRRVKMKCKAL
ncbi:uncharacterized protein LOC141613903 [Silene latifolia]|uniref:uncharacterized protein LOC141613903 n=1 Tax=Silene latifolia TaxID=37657 RepID=UPI003D7746A8